MKKIFNLLLIATLFMACENASQTSAKSNTSETIVVSAPTAIEVQNYIQNNMVFAHQAFMRKPKNRIVKKQLPKH